MIGSLKQEGKPDARVLLLEAALAGEKGETAQAERALVQVATLDPSDQDAAVQLALLRIRKAEATARAAGKPVEAKAIAAEIATLEKATAALPDRADVRYALGFAREIAGDADTALAEYREATRVDPLDGAAYSAAGVQWGMPFNVSNPVLFYNKNIFEAAGLDPDHPPQNLEELRQYRPSLYRALPESGAR